MNRRLEPDGALLREMAQLLGSGGARNPHDAAVQVASRFPESSRAATKQRIYRKYRAASQAARQAVGATAGPPEPPYVRDKLRRFGDAWLRELLAEASGEADRRKLLAVLESTSAAVLIKKALDSD